MAEYKISPQELSRLLDMCVQSKEQLHRPPNVQWPLKIMKISSVSPYFHHANLLIAADCAAFTYSSIASSVNSGHVLMIGCPDGCGSAMHEKLAEIMSHNDIQSVTLLRMDSPCCCRMTDAVIRAIRNSGKDIPLNLTTVFAEGEHVE